MNPANKSAVLGIAFLTIAGILAFVIFVIVMRRLRRRITGEESPGSARPAAAGDEGFAMAAYQGVILRLKEQEKELERLRQAERERAATSANISEAVLSNLASGVLLFNPAGLVSQANQAARNILGYASMVGLHARDIFRGVSAVRAQGAAGDSDAEALLQAVEGASRRGETARRLEADYRSPQGEQRILGVTLSPVRGHGGEALGTACLVSDLTEIVEMGRQMRLREKLAALGEMSAGIAHEFKNSLATISGYAQMLRSENDAATVRQFAERIGQETQSLTRIVTNFLNFSRPRELRDEPMDARTLLEDCAQECSVELRLEDFPAQGLTLHGDPTALRQAFSNLMRNSAEAIDPGRMAQVKVRFEAADKWLRLIFQDNGPGLSPDARDRLFLPFFTTKPQGTGLGLALVHRIVSEHGGTVTASAEGPGATFTLSLPAEKVAGEASQAG